MGCSSSSNAYADPADSKGAGAAKASNTSASSSQRPELPGDELALDVSDIVVIEQSRRELPAKGTPSNSSNSNSHSNQNSNNKKKHRQLLNAIQYVGALTIPETQDIIPQATPVDSSEDISFSGRTFHSMSFEPRSSDSAVQPPNRGGDEKFNLNLRKFIEKSSEDHEFLRAKVKENLAQFKLRKYMHMNPEEFETSPKLNQAGIDCSDSSNYDKEFSFTSELRCPAESRTPGFGDAGARLARSE
ncbi:unnamed protein product [Polarella glacialis]|uniref:Uncharacterized protein n=1 Tax=Polarella glacialis TaxID=89957 RepID=A0A813GC60_POLGL|nr:unnamed protein product [Polarella glacialis]